MSESIFELDVIQEKDIENLIKNKIEESINLDYKRGEALQKSESSKKELAKDVSAFANSAGGLIIYGIGEIDHVPNGYHFVDGEIITKEWIEQVIQTRVHRKIPNLKIIPIRYELDLKKSIYVIKIPESPESPHQTKNKRFYKRYNFESVEMEEYEIRNLYNTKSQVKLTLRDIVATSDSESDFQNPVSLRKGNFKIWVVIRNSGKVYSKENKIQFLIPKSIVNNYGVKSSVDEKYLNRFTSMKSDSATLISKSMHETIFPDELYNYGYFRIKLSQEQVDNIEEFSFRFRIFHEGTTTETEISLKSAFS